MSVKTASGSFRCQIPPGEHSYEIATAVTNCAGRRATYTEQKNGGAHGQRITLHAALRRLARYVCHVGSYGTSAEGIRSRRDRRQHLLCDQRVSDHHYSVGLPRSTYFGCSASILLASHVTAVPCVLCLHWHNRSIGFR